MNPPVVSNDCKLIAIWLTSYLESERDPFKFGFVPDSQVLAEKSGLFVLNRAGDILGHDETLEEVGTLHDIKFLDEHRIQLHPFDQDPIVIDL